MFQSLTSAITFWAIALISFVMLSILLSKAIVLRSEK